MQNALPTFLTSQPRTWARTSSTMIRSHGIHAYVSPTVFVFIPCRPTQTHKLAKRGDRVLDEFALHPDPSKLYTIAYPGITWGGSLEIFSTHRGTANYFNQLILEARHKGNPKKFSLHRVTLQDALDQGFLFKLQQKLPADDERLAHG